MRVLFGLAPAALALATLLTPLDAAGATDDAPVIESERYGSLATGMPYDREIRLGPHTKSVSVWRLETIRFVAAGGRDFTWRFDGLPAMDSFPLARIAPAGFPGRDAAVVHVNGEIPIAP